MRVLTAVIITGTVLILWHLPGDRWLAWLLTRIPPTTPADHAPRYRTWHNGTVTEGPW